MGHSDMFVAEEFIEAIGIQNGDKNVTIAWIFINVV